MSTSPIDNVTSVTPEPVSQMKCCPWRAALQTPLLLIAAAGIGFGGQQVFSNGGDLKALFAGKSSVQGFFSSEESQGCPLAAAGAESGCCASAALAALSTELTSGCSTSSSCCSGGQVASACCSAGASEAVAEADEPLSALQAENAATEL